MIVGMLIGLCWLQAADAQWPDLPKIGKPISVVDLAGRRHVIPSPEASATVAVFITPDCPVANRVIPTLKKLTSDFVQQKVEFYYVYVDASFASDKIREHAKEYALPGFQVFDTRQDLVRAVGARWTPECVIVDRTGQVRYRGRVSDLYADHSRIRIDPVRQDLRIALEECLAGKKVTQPTTPVVGCDIPPPPQ